MNQETDVFTPELMEMLAHIVSGSESSIPMGAPQGEPMSAFLRDGFATTHARHMSLSSDSVDTGASQWGEAHSRMETPSYSQVGSEGSFASQETAVSGGDQLSAYYKQSAMGTPRQVSGGFVPARALSPSMAPTTLMVKNIPNRVTREELAEEIMTKMPVGSFDFLYLPIDFKSRAGFGYAFINCACEQSVDLFISQFHKRRLACADGVYSKPIEVTVARVQGFTANINRLISSPVLFSADEGSLPLIFNRDQVSIPFKALMQLNRASILFQTRPPIEDLIAMVEAEMLH